MFSIMKIKNSIHIKHKYFSLYIICDDVQLVGLTLFSIIL